VAVVDSLGQHENTMISLKKPPRRWGGFEKLAVFDISTQ
jgi:hypothetical protein